jgi:GNAT superfamily N-acetyltransferase
MQIIDREALVARRQHRAILVAVDLRLLIRAPTVGLVEASRSEDARVAGLDEVGDVAALLDAFNREFDTPTPGAEVLVERLRAQLPTGALVAFLAGRPPVAVALVSFRPSVWYPGPAALLEELYVQPELRGRGIGGRLIDAVLAHAVEQGAGTLEINVDESDTDARRFYLAHGFRDTDADSGDRMFFLCRDL